MEADVSDLPVSEEEQLVAWLRRGIDKRYLPANAEERVVRGKDLLRLRPWAVGLIADDD